jgi:O-antigen/teichoic acid export membrane protein
LWFVIIYFVSNTIIGAILYLRIVKIYKPDNTKVDEGVIGYSKHLSVVGMIAGLANNIDQILIFHYIGPAALAVYNFALAIPSQIKGPIKGIAGLIFPKYVEREDHDIKAGMRSKYLMVFLGSAIIIAIYILAAPYIFHIFFPKYMDSVLYSQILSLSLLAMVSIPTEIYFVAKEKIKEQYIVNVSIPIIQIVLMVWFILWMGILGVVIARVIIKILWSIINIWLYERAPMAPSVV